MQYSCELKKLREPWKESRPYKYLSFYLPLTLTPIYTMPDLW